jgi:hypothetical protein
MWLLTGKVEYNAFLLEEMLSWELSRLHTEAAVRNDPYLLVDILLGLIGEAPATTAHVDAELMDEGAWWSWELM